MIKSFDLFNSREREKTYFSHLEKLWEATPANQRTEIEELVERLQNDGVICTVYDFVT